MDETHTDGHKAPFLDSTVVRGRSGGDVMYRIQNKVTDRRNPDAGTVSELPQEERRARIEVTFLGSALAGVGLNVLEDLYGFDFRGLRKDHFQFWLPTTPCDPEDSLDGDARRQGKLFSRSQLLKFFEERAGEALDIAFEACSDAHWLARRLTAQRHRVKLLTPESVADHQIRGSLPPGLCQRARCPDFHWSLSGILQRATPAFIA